MFGFARWIVRRGIFVVPVALALGYLFFSSDAPDKPKSAWANAPVAAPAAAKKKSTSMIGKLADSAIDKASDFAEDIGVTDKAKGMNSANEAFNAAR